MFNESDIRAVQQTKNQDAQLRLFKENEGLVRIIGLEYRVRDIDAFMQDAYLALGDACRLYRWDTSFLSCYRVHLKKAVFKHHYMYDYPVKVNYLNCKKIKNVHFADEYLFEEKGYEDVERAHMLVEAYSVIEKLPQKDQDIIQKRFIEDKTLREIAEEYDVSTVTIHKNINRILGTIKEQLN